MSTQQILGVVGGVVGAFFGYPQLGFVVGSLVGGLLTPGEKTEGPRVDDLEVQVSTYGVGIPILFGTERIGGNVVWSTDKIETSETQGGKGAEPEHTTYRYFVHMGIVLCETPTDGSEVEIIQMFQDGKLIYDARLGIPIGSALASAENPHAFFVLYQGHADQLPDPIEEQYEDGPGSVPAYRGLVRIRMNAVECPGGRIPQFSFVLSNRSSDVKQTEVLASIDGYETEIGVCNASDAWHLRRTRVVGVHDIYDCYYFSSGGAVLNHTILTAPLSYLVSPSPVVSSSPAKAALLAGFGTDTLRIDMLDIENGVLSTYAEIEVPGGSANFDTFGVAFDRATERYVLLNASGSFANQPYVFTSLGGDFVTNSFTGECGPVAMYDSQIYAVLIKTVGSDRLFYVDTMDADTGVITSTVAAPLPAVIATDVVHRSMIRATSEGVFVYLDAAGSTTPHLYSLAGNVWTLISSDASAPAGLQREQPGSFYCTSTMGTFGPSDITLGDTRYSFVRFKAKVLEDYRVSDIIEELCERAEETRYDLSGIPDSDTVHGYKLQNPASARSNIDPLLTAFAIYIVDEDGVIKFKKYEDIESEATIAYDELGQAENGSEPADAMPLNRAQEIDMPRSVTISYIEPTFDYQTASEKAVRRITEATEDLLIELPMATNSDHAKTVSEMILYAKWRGQNTRSFKTSRKYAFLSPGDGVTVEYPRGTFRLWRITSMTDTGVLCEFNVEPGDAELYTQTAIGASGYVRQEVTPLAPITFFTILDTPILRDTDNNAGLYVAMAGAAAGYPGGELFVGADDASLASVGTVNNEAPQGVCESALVASFDGSIDETSLLTVSVGHHALSSVTRDVLLNGTTNVAAVGAAGRWEIIKFQRAASLGGGRYILSGLIRGQRGTEHNMANHAIGDRFVVMGVAGTLRPNFDTGSIGQTRSYRAVTKGRSRESASSRTYANTAEGLKPFSPTTPRKTFTGNDIVLTWGRRTRLSENWLTGSVPIGEASTTFEVVIYSDSSFTTVKRTIEATAATATYTSAQQVEDFGSNQTTVHVRVYQISDVVGRGHQLQATL